MISKSEGGKSRVDGTNATCRALPPSLREYLWGLSLVDPETQDKCWRTVAARAKYWNIPAHKVHTSPIHGLIGKIVAELCDFLDLPLRSTEMARLSSVLNHMYLGSKVYGFREAAMGFELVRTYPDVQFQNLSPMLLRLLELVPVDAVGGLATQAVSLVEQQEPRFHAHVKSLYHNMNPGEFQAVTGQRNLPFPSTFGVVFERWLKYLFVGFLSPPCVDFLWDQLFLFGPKGSSLPLAMCATVFALLGPRILQARNLTELDAIVTTAVQSIKLSELRNAFGPTCREHSARALRDLPTHLGSHQPFR